MEENIFYSKAYVAKSIKLAIEQPSKEDLKLIDSEKFSYFLAIILAKDKEVVAVNMTITPIKCKVYIAKNGPWSQKDKDYIKKVEKTLINISKEALTLLDQMYESDDVKELYVATMKYCSHKLGYKLNKLRNDITNGMSKMHIKSFLDYAKKEGISMDDMFNDKKRPSMSSICNEYYQVAKNDSSAPEEFLKHIKKVGSYVGYLMEIIDCACKVKYKDLFSSIEMNLLDPPCEEMQPISSWKNIVMKYISDERYEGFKNICLEHDEIRKRLENMYGGIGEQLESENSSCTYLHVELNLLIKIMDNDDIKGRKFIAVSKKCCYLCRLYIKFVQSKGYKIAISGSHNKLYHKWKLPNVFRKDFIPYATFYLDGIIEREITHLFNLCATSNNDPESLDSDDSRDYKKVRFVRKIELSDEDL